MSNKRELMMALASLTLAASAAAMAAPQVPEVKRGGAEPTAQRSLQEAAQDPVADMVTIPLQDNIDYRIGAYERARNTLNVQPVIPLHLTEDWTLVARIIVPFISQPDVAPSGGSSGLGDVSPTFFLAPAGQGKVIWGAGPALIVPTATQVSLGTGKWSLGPSAVVLTQPRPWTLGVLASQVWSFAGASSRSHVSRLTIQYFVNYNLPAGWYLTSSPIITADFAGSDRWVLPFGAGAGRIFEAGGQNFNAQLALYGNAVHPDGEAVWQLRLQVALLFPR